MNYYTNYCEQVLIQPPSVTWWGMVASDLDAMESSSAHDEDFDEDEAFRQFTEKYDIGWDRDEPGFDDLVMVRHQFEATHLPEPLLRIHDEGGHAALDVLVPLLRAHLHEEHRRKPNADGVIRISWAATSDRPRPGECGGGAVLVTLDGAHWMSTHDWLREEVVRYAGAVAARDVVKARRREMAARLREKRRAPGRRATPAKGE